MIKAQGGLLGQCTLEVATINIEEAGTLRTFQKAQLKEHQLSLELSPKLRRLRTP
jgi:hypothetical protein